MVLNPDSQIRNFPALGGMERSWEQNIRASLDLLAPGEGVRAGLKLGLPLAAGVVTTGLLPTLTDGYLVRGDNVLGPYGSKFARAAAPNLANKNIFFGLKGMGYGDENNAAPYFGDARIGSISTDADSILHLGQQYNYGAARFGVRGVVNLAKAPKGADTTFFTWTPAALGLAVMPGMGLDNVRVTYAQARVMEAVGSGNATGDDLVFKVKNGEAAAVTLGTIAAASLTAGTIVRKNPLTADVLSFYQPSTIAFQYNQTDAGGNFVGGAVEIMVVLEAF